MYRNCFIEAYEEMMRVKRTIQDLKNVIENLDRIIQNVEYSLDYDEELTEYEEIVLENELHSTIKSRERAIQCLKTFEK
jgi:hypothetical protein